MSEKAVVFVIPPPVPVTVTLYVPVRTESDVLMVKIVEQFGEQGCVMIQRRSVVFIPGITLDTVLVHVVWCE